MSLELPRADDLRVIRELCYYASTKPDETIEVGSLQRWLSTHAPGHDAQWKRARAYHYTSAAIEFNLLARCYLNRVTLTRIGRSLAELHAPDCTFRCPLSEEEKQLFREVLPNSDAVRSYLAIYMPEGRPPESISQFTKYGRPIALVRCSAQKFELATPGKGHRFIERTEKASIAWTLYVWLRDLDLVDDLYHERPTSFLVGDREARMFYPIRTKNLKTKALRNLLVRYASAAGNKLAVYYLPDLLANVCARRGIPKKLFLEKLVELFEEEPSHFHLEMMSSLRSDKRCGRHYRYQNFPEVAGVMRSHLVMRLY
jgi:hypothetical protein